MPIFWYSQVIDMGCSQRFSYIRRSYKRYRKRTSAPSVSASISQACCVCSETSQKSRLSWEVGKQMCTGQRAVEGQ